MEFVYIILLAVCLIIPATIAYVLVKSRGTSKKKRGGGNSNGDVDNRIFPNKTKEHIKKEAIDKYEHISDLKRNTYWNKYKKKVLITHISIICVSLLLFILFTVLSLVNGFSVSNIVMMSVSLFFCIVCGASLIFHLKREKRKVVIRSINIELAKIYKKLTYQRVDMFKPYVWKHSDLCKKIEDINSKYSFDRATCRQHKYYYDCKSKRELDTFDYDRSLFAAMLKDEEFFKNLQIIYDANCSKYEAYVKEYEGLEKYTKEIDIENLDLDYETFHSCECMLYRERRQAPITAPSVMIEISYTSPSGRNHYKDQKIYSLNDLRNIYDQKQKELLEQLIKQKKQEELERKRREKERKLKHLEKYEKELIQREEEVAQKEKDFLEATQGHIYTNDKVKRDEIDIAIEDNISLGQKISLLKDEYYSGKINYEEYQARRKELL